MALVKDPYPYPNPKETVQHYCLEIVAHELPKNRSKIICSRNLCCPCMLQNML